MLCCMKFVRLINVNIITFTTSFLLNIAEHENFCVNKNFSANKIPLLINMKLQLAFSYLFRATDNFLDNRVTL